MVAVGDGAINESGWCINMYKPYIKVTHNIITASDWSSALRDSGLKLKLKKWYVYIHIHNVLYKYKFTCVSYIFIFYRTTYHWHWFQGATTIRTMSPNPTPGSIYMYIYIHMYIYIYIHIYKTRKDEHLLCAPVDMTGLPASLLLCGWPRWFFSCCALVSNSGMAWSYDDWYCRCFKKNRIIKSTNMSSTVPDGLLTSGSWWGQGHNSEPHSTRSHFDA